MYGGKILFPIIAINSSFWCLRCGLFRNRRRSVASLMDGSIIDLVPRLLWSQLEKVLL